MGRGDTAIRTSLLYPGGQIRVRHKLFEEIENTRKGLKGKMTTNTNASKWKICDWPSTSDAAKHARDNLADAGTHKPCILHTYDETDNEIAPADYASTLKGALVKVVISVSRWIISNQWVFGADIQSRSIY
ncbi:hypothetical protein NEOLEDRAFT_1132458 [Neolentinus lepideus HHB14362 ss-1]|uniref:Uncharacterized protein n=1 Tax=Neolentinus lepideus HHB14362 ss-1 TaxID=1314782 RepID=A0A165Q758_9AGAM|nr:hypothetical protein NEOLEDRAFT_1138542 [Neolentinus lepideus HHB14362 ss-1]KZT26407.1 hypothetical protein NEOLEDRAFT_1132458 [Neolentinus lepideus HHB14362 ss-1]